MHARQNALHYRGPWLRPQPLARIYGVVSRCKALSATAAAPETVGVVIVDHGSRRKDSNLMLEEFGMLYQQTMQRNLVEIAHMEIAEPSIEQAIGKCITRGAQRIVVAPYFLSRGRHIQDDIPALVKEAQEKYPDVPCIIADPIGIDPLMAQLIENRVSSALHQQQQQQQQQPVVQLSQEEAVVGCS